MQKRKKLNDEAQEINFSDHCQAFDYFAQTDKVRKMKVKKMVSNYKIKHKEEK